MSYLRTYSIAFLIVICAGQAGFGFAQSWNRPAANPPANNAGQPPSTTDLANYVKKSVTATQSVLSGASFGTGTPLPSYFGNSSNLTIAALGTSNGVPAIAGTRVGVFGNGGPYGLVAYVQAGSGTSYAVSGSSSVASGYGARWYGPVAVMNLASPSVNGTVAADGSITAQGGLGCASPCTLATGSYWLTGTHTAGGSAVKGTGTSGAGISFTIDDGVNGNSIAVDAYPVSPATVAIGGYSNTNVGAYGNAGGTAGLNYIGVAGVAQSSNANAIGMYGLSTGGVGSPNYGTAQNPDYDQAAGIRACVKQSDGTVVNKRGITGTGAFSVLQADGDAVATMASTINGVDDGTILILPNSQGEGVLRIGNQYLSKCDFQGIKNKMCDLGQTQYCPKVCPSGCSNMISC